MASKKSKIGYHETSKRYYKNYKGKRWWSDSGTPDTPENRARSLIEFAAWKDRQDGDNATTQSYYASILEWQKAARIMRLDGKDKEAKAAEKEVKRLQQAARKGLPLTVQEFTEQVDDQGRPFIGWSSVPMNTTVVRHPETVLAKVYHSEFDMGGVETWHEKERALGWIAEKALGETTVSLALEKWIADCTKAQPQTTHRYRYKVSKLVEFLGADYDVANIGRRTIAEFKEWIGKQESLAKTKGDVCRTVRCFIDWLWRQGYIQDQDAIRNLKDLSFPLSGEDTDDWKERHKKWTPEEVERLMAYSNDQYKAIWLLMLNCGFQQVDIGALDVSQFIEKDGKHYVIHRREKVRKAKPVIYKLWSETVAALAKASNKSGLVFTTRNGKALYEKYPGYSRIREKYSLNNSTLKRYGIRIKAGLTKEINQLRKTGASILRGSDHKEWRELWLGHSEGWSDRAYASDVEDMPEWQAGFDQAVDYLRDRILPASLKLPSIA